MQLVIGIFQGRPDLDVAAAGIDLRIDRRNLAGEGLVLEGVDLHGNRLAQPNLIDRLLRHEEVDKDRIERLQRHDDRSGPEILAEIDGADAEMAGKRRAQEFLVEDGLLLGHLRAWRSSDWRHRYRTSPG